jgi:hypothetical protein
MARLISRPPELEPHHRMGNLISGEKEGLQHECSDQRRARAVQHSAMSGCLLIGKEASRSWTSQTRWQRSGPVNPSLSALIPAGASRPNVSQFTIPWRRGPARSPYLGHLDEVCITAGIARDASDAGFTVPARRLAVVRKTGCRSRLCFETETSNRRHAALSRHRAKLAPAERAEDWFLDPFMDAPSEQDRSDERSAR